MMVSMQQRKLYRAGSVKIFKTSRFPTAKYPLPCGYDCVSHAHDCILAAG
ncbi:hypothetical protein QFZ56_004606 [Streptomyces achromogenes]|uniref:Uncharacterized protein n=1 Tax=Streptomyces achromogenes TaxID=67255 RepID=A0ABU0Q4Q2_STRAH|nr:hypothetical protein [Streptomyces achromogenes]